MADQSSDLLRAAWRRFTGLHDELFELALSEGDLDEAAAAALLGRMVGHIQYMGLQLRSDPARPTLVNTQYSPWNWGHSNPDTLYLSARIDDAHDYRVYGRLGSVAQTTFGVYTGNDDQALAVKALAEDIAVDEDGSFEIFFSRDKMVNTNWFQLPPGAESFCAYQTYGDWEREHKGSIRIECLNVDEPVKPVSLHDSIAAFDAHLAASRELFTMWVKDIPARVFGAPPKNFAVPPLQPPWLPAWVATQPGKKFRLHVGLVSDRDGSVEHPGNAQHIGLTRQGFVEVLAPPGVELIIGAHRTGQVPGVYQHVAGQVWHDRACIQSRRRVAL